MIPRIKDDRPRCECGELPHRASRGRYYCKKCRTYVKKKEPEFASAIGYENYALFALTGHFPRVAA